MKEREAVTHDLEAALGKLAQVKPRDSVSGQNLAARKEKVRAALATVKAEPLDVPPLPPPPPSPTILAEGNFENGLQGWNTAGVGDAIPTVVSDIVREGSHSGRVILPGFQGRAELILGGDGSSAFNPIKFTEGGERTYAFSVFVDQLIWGHPGAHNIFFQLKGDGTGSPLLALQLWNWMQESDGKPGGKGLWISDATGDYYAAPFALNTWHDLKIKFKVSGLSGGGSYAIELDSTPIASNPHIQTLASGHEYAYIKDGLYRNGAVLASDAANQEISSTSELRLDAARLSA